jgi:putative tricarboxylic transport membrane protein
MRTANIISSFIAVGIALLFYVMANQFKDIPVQDTGPAFMPQLYAGILVILAILLLINSLKAKGTSKNNSSNSKLVFITMVLVALLVSLIPILGFYIITPIAVVAFLLICKEKNPFILIGLPLGIVLFIYVLFQKLLLVPIPLGKIFQ